MVENLHEKANYFADSQKQKEFVIVNNICFDQIVVSIGDEKTTQEFLTELQTTGVIRFGKREKGEVMKLYIKQKIFSIGDKYDVYDMDENVIFDVKSEIFTIGAKLHLCDTSGNELYYIKRRLTFMLAQYEIYKNNSLCAIVSQEFALFRPKLNIDSSFGKFDIEGDFLRMDYTITKNGQCFGSLHKVWLSWGDSYELDIPYGENAGFLCALVIAIDNCLHKENK